MRVVEPEPGSLQEEKFMLMAPASNRERGERQGLSILPRESLCSSARRAASVRGEDTSRVVSWRRLVGSLRVLIVTLAVAAAVEVRYGIVQLFICDLRDLVFRGMPRCAPWLCP